MELGRKVRDREDALARHARRVRYPDGRVAFTIRCDFYAVETAQATSPASPTLPGKMDDADSAPRCNFPQAVAERSRRITWTYSGVPCRKTLRGMWWFRGYR